MQLVIDTVVTFGMLICSPNPDDSTPLFVDIVKHSKGGRLLQLCSAHKLVTVLVVEVCWLAVGEPTLLHLRLEVGSTWCVANTKDPSAVVVSNWYIRSITVVVLEVAFGQGLCKVVLCPVQPCMDCLGCWLLADVSQGPSIRWSRDCSCLDGIHQGMDH